MKILPTRQEAAEFEHLRYLYTAALRAAETQLDILRCDFVHSAHRNPIHHIESRVKTLESMLEKLTRKGLSRTAQAAKENLKDIAGLRVVCPSIQDVYAVSAWIKAQENLRLLRMCDYIETPKDNGYRSLHLIIAVPLHLLDETSWVPVEVQIRTLAMDFWASWEHQLCYKNEGTIPPLIIDELRRSAEKIAAVDRQMQSVQDYLQKPEAQEELMP